MISLSSTLMHAADVIVREKEGVCQRGTVGAESQVSPANQKSFLHHRMQHAMVSYVAFLPREWNGRGTVAARTETDRLFSSLVKSR